MPSKILLPLVVSLGLADAFVHPSSSSSLASVPKNSRCEDSHNHGTAVRSPTRCYNFLSDAFENAFSNDRTLSTDKAEGQYDDMYVGEEYIENDPKADDGLTEVQRKWRESQQLSGQSSPRVVNYEAVVGSSLTMDLYLSGVPDRDPSNDLYGSKVNISSRDKVSGLSLPSAPSVSIQLQFLEGGICRSSESGFTSDEAQGEWKVSEDGSVLRFSINALGYTRMVQTKGSIQNVYWTDEEEKNVQTSTTYSIPPGLVYGDVRVIPGRKQGTFEIDGKEGSLRIEKSTGLFGIASQMVACGKFVASTVA